MIERVEVDGRKGAAAWVDDRFNPVAKDKATLVKIVFDDGEQLILNAVTGQPRAPSK